ncbi:MAG: hypothetical protein IJ748_04060 [Bacteroidales bacterium]|nr:hypothetical protein [Bacteroidales bacterium]
MMLNRLKILILCFFALYTPFLYAQNKNNAREDFEFIKYLIGNDMKEEALIWANGNFSLRHYGKDTEDTINFLRAWTFYSSKSLTKAKEHFEKVGDSSLFKPASVFFSSLSQAYLGEYTTALDNLVSNKDLLTKFSELRFFEQAGLSLLKRDFHLYEDYRKNFFYSSYLLKDNEQALDSIYLNLKNYKAKSPFLSACLSAIAPGLGKIYAGSLGEGLSSFVTVGSFAAIATENWIKHGFVDWRTILFTSIGTVFYIGNIYGSIVRVKIDYDEFTEKQNLSILYTIHLPLRNVFGL